PRVRPDHGRARRRFRSRTTRFQGPPTLAYTPSEVTTGALIYLVSACRSGEEFVAAFRRYADRSGLFIPIAEPIAAGRRGRFAVALHGGGVMIEGEAEVVSSARTPSVLHGR